MQSLYWNSAIRIRPPSLLTNQKWQAENYDSGKSFSVPELAVAILLYCYVPRDQNAVIAEFSKLNDYPATTINAFLNNLLEKKLLLNTLFEKNQSESKPKLLLRDYLQWKKYNWSSSAEYHFFTYNYQFLDYSEGGEGWKLADKRMKDYSEKEPDTNRIKQYPNEFRRVNVPTFHDISTNLESYIGISNQNSVDLNKLISISAFAFAKTNGAPIRWKGVPLIRRTSPSGGSRHPTEGYIIITGNFVNFNSGLYHIQSDPFALVQLTSELPVHLEYIFPELYEEIPQPNAILILTSVFGRNMFRYREPRTFRTIHMDVGHILGTIELISEHVGLKSKTSYYFDENSIEKALNIDGISEGAIACIGLFK